MFSRKHLGKVSVLCFLSLSLPLLQARAVERPGEGFVSVEMIEEAVKYPGGEAEQRLKDLLRSDYHIGQAKYYLNRHKSGFMALERFNLVLERGIGDIREVAYIKDDGTRKEKARVLFSNWQQGFRRSLAKNQPE